MSSRAAQVTTPPDLSDADYARLGELRYALRSFLHWADGADGRGVLMSGDTLFVTPGEDRLSFVYSAPNRLPLSERAVQVIVDALGPYAFDRVYGGWWTPVLRGNAQAVLDRSAGRYIELLRGD